MRHGVGIFGLVCSAIVISVAARYGYKTADNELDAWIWAFTYGAVTFAGLGGHMVGVRLWRYGKRGFALTIFAASFFALLISLSNSLGAMAGRMNTTVAARIQTADLVRDARNDLKQKQEERAALRFTPSDKDAVAAANRKAAAATAAKDEACKYVSQRCRDREKEEISALGEASQASRDMSITDHASDLDAEIKALKEKIEKAGPVLEANSQGNALARLFALPEGDAAQLSTYQNLAMAIGIEILIVLSLIAYEVMTEHEHERRPLPMPEAPQAPIMADAEPLMLIEAAPKIEEVAPTPEPIFEEAPTTTIEPEPKEEVAPRTFPPRRPRLIASEAAPFGNVAEILDAALENATRGKLELAPVFQAYLDACRAQGKRPVSQDRFVDDLTAFCRDSGIAMTGDDTGIYLRKVRLKKSGKSANA